MSNTTTMDGFKPTSHTQAARLLKAQKAEENKYATVNDFKTIVKTFIKIMWRERNFIVLMYAIALTVKTIARHI